jgi:GNAT superfamily N-acetyltransferase
MRGQLPATEDTSKEPAMILLPSSEYHHVASLLSTVPFNTLFARAVLQGHVRGRVHVDEPLQPCAGYVAHPYGMSLLFGETDNERFNAALLSYLLGDATGREKPEWLQTYPDSWTTRLQALLGHRLLAFGATADTNTPDSAVVRQDVRVNFRFDAARYAQLRQSLRLPPDCEMIDDPGTLYDRMQGSVVPRAFWDTREEFASRGVARAVRCQGELASTAFASFAIGDALEIGIETYPRFRGRGLGVHACSALIDHCLQHGLEPVWACRLGNTASYSLATKLGFENVLSLPYYRLPETVPAAVLPGTPDR